MMRFAKKALSASFNFATRRDSDYNARIFPAGFLLLPERYPMTCDFYAIAAPGVRGLQPYPPGKPLSELEREYGVRDAIKLASNENPLGPSPQALEVIRSRFLSAELARYPDGGGFELKHALATKLGVAENQITLGNGSNDVLELAARAFVSPGQGVMFSQHGFAVYPITAQAVGARSIVVPAKNWGHDLSAMLAAIEADTKLIYVANPNNPTGTWLRRDELHAFLRAAPECVIIVVDEAYFEYVEQPDYPNAVEWLAEFPNLIVTRTFSKAYALAGLRVGYAVSQAAVADLFNRVRQPFNVNSIAQAAACAALQDSRHLSNSIAVNSGGMCQLTSEFERLGLSYIPSVGNFVSVDVGRPGAEVYESLLRQGVIVRPVGNYGMPTHLRVTVGLEHENERFIKALAKVLGK
jgi:histidinol-phosphate aminotransferase